VKPAAVRFYVDADVLGLAEILAKLRYDVTYPGDPGAVIHKHQRPACDIDPSTLDTNWLPVVARAGWLIITRDANIQQHTAEINAVRDHGGKMVALASADATNTWAQLEVVMTQWREIEKLASLPGPYVYTAYRTKLTKVA
jgi:hypothetical protein